MQADSDFDELVHRSTDLRTRSARARADAAACQVATQQLLASAADLCEATRKIRDTSRLQRSRRRHY